jgi:hypothetical protein
MALPPVAPGGNDEVVHADTLRRLGRPPRSAAILEGPHQFLLLGVDRDRRLLPALVGPDLPRDGAKLRIPIGVLPAFASLDVALQAVAEAVQQLGDHRVADGMTERLKGSPSGRACDVRRNRFRRRISVVISPRTPSTGTSRVACSLLPWPGCACSSRSTAGATPDRQAPSVRPAPPGRAAAWAEGWSPASAPRRACAHPRHRQGDVGITVRQSSSDRRRREPRRAGHQRDAPVSEGSGFRRRPQAARPLSAGPHAWRGASREARVTVPRCFTTYKSLTTVILTVPNQARAVCSPFGSLCKNQKEKESVCAFNQIF